MQVVTRSKLAAFLTGSTMDPDGHFNEEMTAFAAAILADSPAALFTYTDHENGNDPEVQWPEYSTPTAVELVPLTYNKAGDSYYGVEASRCELIPGDQRVLYNCYLGGSPLNSAPGFVIAAAMWGADPE